ncbi:MAG: hypothetical protein IPO29_16155 [Anaerolineae bacterium]|nr:hypothetical protein [Anaerolineae bacterium]HRA54287.1 hypothetical protein [Thermoflexales bacterium]
MKNITVAIDEETYRKARIKAAEKSTSVSALVRDFLSRLDDEEGEAARFARLLQQQDELVERIRAMHTGFSAADNLSREALHDRHALH